jgi:hypothetical protein
MQQADFQSLSVRCISHFILRPLLLVTLSKMLISSFGAPILGIAGGKGFFRLNF